MIVRLLLFASAREAAGRANDDFDLAGDAALEDLVHEAVDRYGDRFAQVLATARVWVNGDEPESGPATTLRDHDEIAVLPPVSGGADCGSSVRRDPLLPLC